MARSTVVNIALGLERAGYRLTMAEMREKIKDVGIAVAERHIQYVQHDIKYSVGNNPGLLSPEQMAHYHHIAFQMFNIAPDSYGGTLFRSVPNEWEFKMYGSLYCFDCDNAEGFDSSTLR